MKRNPSNGYKHDKKKELAVIKAYGLITKKQNKINNTSQFYLFD